MVLTRGSQPLLEILKSLAIFRREGFPFELS
jgi:hypothetical protein